MADAGTLLRQYRGRYDDEEIYEEVTFAEEEALTVTELRALIADSGFDVLRGLRGAWAGQLTLVDGYSYTELDPSEYVAGADV